MIIARDSDIYTHGYNSDDAYSWYVVHCRTGKEAFASELLKATLGLQVYISEMKVWEKGRARFITLFPGYLFIQADLQKVALSQINNSPGVLRILGPEGIPQKVPAQFVASLRAEMIRFNDACRAPNQDFHSGDLLHFKDGPLCGLEAVFIGATTPGKRVQVLLNILGRPTRTDVEVDVLEKRTSDVRSGRVRSTRGKRRKIHNQSIEKGAIATWKQDRA